MYKNWVVTPEFQKMSGHTTLAMTAHYLRSVTSEEDTLQNYMIFRLKGPCTNLNQLYIKAKMLQTIVKCKW